MILALDLSRHCGWAAGAVGTRPICGVWELPSQDEPDRQAAAFADALGDALALHTPALVVMEVDVGLHKQNPCATAYQQIGMAYLTGLLCFRRKVKLISKTASEARKAVIGQSHFGGSGGAKAAVMRTCAMLGHPVQNHNSADALILWWFGESIAKQAKLRIAA